MDLNKLCVGIMVLVALSGILVNSENKAAYGAEQWIKENQSSIGMTDLTATITVIIKNNNKNVQYFKISQVYTSKLDTPVLWTVTGSCPSAKKMVKASSPELGGDWGWKINPGQTKKVTFKVKAAGLFGLAPAYISNNAASENVYWPLLPEPGLYSSWFWPNEIEMLNPSLDLKSWKGTFSFNLRNYDPQRKTVSGIIRGPIIPLDSKLVSVSPRYNYFTDSDIFLNTNTVAWDITISPGSVQHYRYTYIWPASKSSSLSSTGTFSSSVPETAAAGTESPTVPTKETGVPYGLFVVGGIIAAGSVIYARFLR